MSRGHSLCKPRPPITTWARFDPKTGSWEVHPVGAKPCTYSDFTGDRLNRIAQPRGRRRVVMD